MAAPANNFSELFESAQDGLEILEQYIAALTSAPDIVRAHDLAVSVVREYETIWYECRLMARANPAITASPQWRRFTERLRNARGTIGRISFRRVHYLMQH